MNIKRKIVRILVDITDGWNKEIHEAIEQKIHNEYKISFHQFEDDSLEDVIERKEKMRTYYYQRMSVTATLLLSALALIAATIAIVLQVL